MTDPLDFSDLEEDLSLAVRPSRQADSRPTWTNPCPKCRGTGRFFTWGGRDHGPCHMCKGSGKLTFKTSPDYREQARAKAAARKAQDRAEWRAEHAAEVAWVERKAPTFEFAMSLSVALDKWGSLTDRQLDAVRKCMARDAERQAARPRPAIEPVQAAPVSLDEAIPF